MAFEYTPYRNPYIGTIADLMARGEDAKAKALIDVASAQARAAEAKGQIYGNAISSIGQDISKSLRDYNSPAAKQQREMDQAQAILKARGLETRQDERMRVNPGNFQAGRPYDVFTDAPVEGLADKAFSGIDFRGNLNPSVRTDATFRMVDGEPIEVPAESFSGLPSAISRSNVFGGQPDTAPSDGLSRSMAGVLGQVETRMSPSTGNKASLESYKTAPVGRYTTEQGMYDVKTAYNDLIQAGISPTVAGALAGQGQQANAIFAAFDKQKEDLAKTEVAMRGSIANMVLNTYKANPNVPIEDILPSVMGPAGSRIPAQDLEDFQVAMFGKSPQEQIQMLQSLVKQWDDQGAKQVVNPGDYVRSASGSLEQIGAKPVSPTEQTFAQNMSDWKASGSKLPFNEWLYSGRRGPGSLEQQILTANAAGDTNEVKRLLAVETDMAKARRVPPDPAAVAAAGVDRQIAQARLKKLEEESAAADRSTTTRKELPEGFNAAFGRATLRMPSTQRENFDKTLEDIASRKDPKELLSFLRQAAIEGSPVEQQKLIQSRIDGVQALGQVKSDLAALKAKGVNTGIVRGTVEQFAQALGTSTDTRLAAIAVRIAENLIIYRQAISGAAFSESETKLYEKIMPGFSNTFGLNEALIDSLLKAWSSREKSFWNVKLGGDWGSRMINDLSGSDLGANFGSS